MKELIGLMCWGVVLSIVFWVIFCVLQGMQATVDFVIY